MNFLYIYRALVKTQHNAIIKCFHCDLGGEYTSNKFSALYASDVLFIRLLALTFLNRMSLLKEKIVMLLKLLVPFYFLLQFQVSFRVKLLLLLSMLLIESHPLLPQVCLPSKSCMVVFLITLL